MPLTPEQRIRQREYQRKYAAKPGVKQRQKEYERKYRVKPAVKERKRKQAQKPEVLERKRLYSRLYYGTIAGREGQRTWTLQKRYGLTIETWDRMLANQNGCCAVCKEKSAVVVDHDHQTNLVRGLLCNECNVGIGWLGDNPVRLQAALDYLHHHLSSVEESPQLLLFDRSILLEGSRE